MKRTPVRAQRVRALGVGMRRKIVSVFGVLWRWVSAPLIFVVLLSCVLALAVALGFRPEWAKGTLTWVEMVLDPVDFRFERDAGQLGVAVLVLLVGVAPFVHDTRYGLFRVALLSLAVMASGVIVTEWLPAPSVGLRLVLVGVCGTVVGKLLLLQRFASFHRAKVSRSQQELTRLLPFQEKDLGKLQEAILASELNDAARVIQLVGRWGEGKSFLVERLSLFLRHRTEGRPESARCAVIVVDVWQQETEPDLYLAVVEEILGHRSYWYPYGWLLYPLWLFIGRAAKEARLAVSAGSGTSAKLELPLKIPRPTGQRALARLVARARRRKWRTVVVLDEVDRAVPPVVQAAVTLASRSLDMPGVIVVLSYVDEPIRYKAFNPLVDGLLDVGSTMRAVIFAEGPDRGSFGTSGGAPGSILQWHAWLDAKEALSPSASSSPSPSSNSHLGPTADYDHSRLAEAIRVCYAGASQERRRMLQRRFAERYLGTRPITMKHPKHADVASMLTSFDTLRYVVFGLVAPGQAQAVVGAAKEALQNWGTAGYEVPSLRALEGEIFRRLSSVSPEDQSLPHVSPQFIAAVVLAAYDAAGLDYARRTPQP